MSSTPNNIYYTGNPKAPLIPEKWKKLPFVDPKLAEDPKYYVAPKDLRNAVNIALELGLPLLLTGEPGVGKSCLARSLNRELGHKEADLLHYTVKSDTRDSDLFYSYDTLSRFHAVHGQINMNDEAAQQKAEDAAHPRRFIRYQALGLAILQAKGRDNIPSGIMTDEALEAFPKQRRRAVVLIDEIDKAPHDMPNDILNEIERMEFRIPELFIDETIKLDTEEDKKHRPIVIITSNGIRELPEAFLRRCLYFHLTMPKFKEELENTDPNEVSVEAIVASRFGEDHFNNREELLGDALSLFQYLRQDSLRGLQRKPSLAEFLDWLRYLSKSNDSTTRLIERNDFEVSVKSALLKNQKDQTRIEALIEGWKNKAKS